MYEVYSETRPQPLLDFLEQSTQKDCELEPSAVSKAPTQCATAIENGIMPETSTVTRSKLPSIDSIDLSNQEKLEVSTGTTPDIPT
ncbi:hypothetical protein N7447_005993 [Penicillium robsamsonii]|uniref:uncharacterized protein n=1 Tax=Penicillium robsamsonii TaxID=1792511 RepID=UPI00254812FE|nr:uncharacterized protein N7447_005993 [Penicillium robsamsonii]KAJ5823653.1 hypothetical protein N7447_005993 [Penicillium robsamsonii]